MKAHHIKICEMSLNHLRGNIAKKKTGLKSIISPCSLEIRGKKEQIKAKGNREKKMMKTKQ